MALELSPTFSLEAELRAVADAHDHRSAELSSEVHADGTAISPRVFWSPHPFLLDAVVFCLADAG
jgi:hypothetical protein